MNKSNHDLALLLLRIGIGVVFIVAGWGKLTGIEGVQGFFGDLGIPMAGLMAWVVAIVEFFGGIMVLIGLYPKIPALLLAFIMVVAIFTVKLEQGFGPMRVDLLLLLMCLAIFFTGSGKFSADSFISGKKD
ncbi:MAG: DoxX family protein [Balneolaceae bacterium]